MLAKKIEKRLIFGEVVGKSLVSCFFLTRDVDVEQAIFAAGCSMKVGVLATSHHTALHDCMFLAFTQ